MNLAGIYKDLKMKSFGIILLIFSLVLLTSGSSVQRHYNTKDGDHCLFKGQRILPGALHEVPYGFYKCNADFSVDEWVDSFFFNSVELIFILICRIYPYPGSYKNSVTP